MEYKISLTSDYKLYVNDILDMYEKSGCGYHIGGLHMGSPTCADDIILPADNPYKLQVQLLLGDYYANGERYTSHPQKICTDRI